MYYTFPIIICKIAQTRASNSNPSNCCATTAAAPINSTQLLNNPSPHKPQPLSSTLDTLSQIGG